LPSSEEELGNVPSLPVLHWKQHQSASRESSEDNGNNSSEDECLTSKKKKDRVTDFWDSDSIEPPKGYYRHLKLALDTVKVKWKYIQTIKA
jgi:DNA replication protein DnaD